MVGNNCLNYSLGRMPISIRIDGLRHLIVDSLIGPSNHAFMQALSAHPPVADRPRIVSANQTEADLAALGPAGEGMLTIGAWFEALDDPATVAFRDRIAALHGPDYRASCFFATAHAAVHLLAAGLEAAGTQEPRTVFAAVAGRPQDTVLGQVEINPLTRHTSLVPRLAVAEHGAFRIVSDAGQMVPPDPYLTNLAPLPVDRTADQRPNLRIVS